MVRPSSRTRSEGEAFLQDSQGLVDALEEVGVDLLVAVDLPVPGGGHRHDGAEDRPRGGPDPQVVRAEAGALGHGPRHHRDRAGKVVHGPGPDLGDGHAQLGRLPEPVPLLLGEAGRHGLHRGPDGGDHAQFPRLLLDGLHQGRLHVVLEDDVFLGREVAEEGARRDLGRRGDLLHRGGLVALLPEEPQRLLADGGPGPGLLPLAQTGRLAGSRADYLGHSPNSARWAGESSAATRVVPAWAAPSWLAPSWLAPSWLELWLRVRRGKNTTASSALARAMPPHTHSMTSSPCTNESRFTVSSAVECTFWATATPASTPVLAALVSAVGRPAPVRWLW